MHGSLVIVDDVPGEFAERVIEAFHIRAERHVLDRPVRRPHGPALLRAARRRRRHADRLVEGRRLLGRRALRAPRRPRLELPAGPRGAARPGRARPTPPTRCAATRAPIPTSCGSASSAGSTSCTSGSAPTGTPPRCSPTRRRSTADPGRLVAMNEDPSGRNPHPRMTLTFAGIARARLVVVTVMGEEKREALKRRGRGRPDVPASHVRADKVVWLADHAAAGDLRVTRCARRRAGPIGDRLRVDFAARGGPDRRCAPMLDRRRELARVAASTSWRARADGRCATRGTGTRVTYSPKVFIPLTMLCRDRCGYCTFAQPPARLDDPVPVARAGAAHRPGRGPAGLPRGPVHPGRAARGALPGRPRVAGRRTATRRRSTTWRPCAGWCSTRSGLLPHANAGALYPDELALLRAVGAVAGDDARVAQRRSGRPPRCARQGARPPPGHARGRRRAGHPVHHRDPRRHRRVPPGPHRRPGGHRRGAPPARPRAGGDRPELPAEAGHRHARSAAVPDRRVPRRHRPGPADPAGRRPPAGAAEPLRRLRRPARRRHRRLGRRLAGHRRPREPRAPVAGARPAAGGHRGHGASRWRPASPSTPSTCSTPNAGSTRACASPCSTAPTPRAWPATIPAPCSCSASGRRRPSRSTRASRCSTSGPARRSGTRAARADRPRSCPAPSTRRPRCRRRGARRRAHGPGGRPRRDRDPLRRPGPRGRRGVRGGRRAAPRCRGRRGHLRAQPQHQLHERVHVQVPVLRVLEGPAVAQPAGHALPADPRRHRRPGPRGRRAGGHRGVPAGRHPPRASTATTTST